jgi:Formate hydrogenlyase subunit 4
MLDRVVTPFAGLSIEGKVLALDGWALAPVNVEFSSLSTPVLALLLVALSMLGLGLVAAFGGLVKQRYYKTWGCGINLTPRMEYTATGFVQPIKRVFAAIYQPTVKLETELLEESRYFAKRRHFEFHIEPVFQKYLYDPVVSMLHRHGRAAKSHSGGKSAPVLGVYLRHTHRPVVIRGVTGCCKPYSRCAQTIVLLTVSPFLVGLIRKVKAGLQLRRGASVFQPYADLAKALP